jgi:hypothetical protein
VLYQYEKEQMKKHMKNRMFEDFSPGDTISMQYRQALGDPKDVPILIEGLSPRHTPGTTGTCCY